MTEFIGRDTIVFPFEQRGYGSVAVMDRGPLAPQPIRLRIQGCGGETHVDFGPRQARALAEALTEHAKRWEP